MIMIIGCSMMYGSKGQMCNFKGVMYGSLSLLVFDDQVNHETKSKTLGVSYTIKRCDLNCSFVFHQALVTEFIIAA